MGSVKQAEYVTVADWLWHAALRELDPAPSLEQPYQPGSTINRTQSYSDYPRPLVQAVLDYLSEDLECDHSVNICMCGPAAVVEELLLNMDGKETCGDCGGEGYIWDEAKYKAERARLLAEWGGEELWHISDEVGYMPCSRCDKTGKVEQDA